MRSPGHPVGRFRRVNTWGGACPHRPGVARSERACERTGVTAPARSARPSAARESEKRACERTGVTAPARSAELAQRGRASSGMTTVILVGLIVVLLAAAAYVGVLLLRRTRSAPGASESGDERPRTVADLVRRRTDPADDLSG